VTRMWFSRVVAALGLAALVLGGTLYAARGTGSTAWTLALAAGAGLIALVAVLNRRALLAFLRGRGARRGADAVLATIFFTAVLAVVQATSVRRSHLFDLTRNQRNTLAPQTTALLDSLDRDVTATAFFRQNSPGRAGAEQMLGLYARLSPRFRFRLVDPDRHPDLVEQLGASADEIVVEARGVRRIARATGEDALTNALLQVTRTGAKTVYFLAGHGERDLDLKSSDGFSAVRAGLESQGYAVRPLSLLGPTAVPDDAAVVVLAGPRSDLLAPEATLLRAYLGAGGSLLALIDPRVRAPQLEGLLADFHLALLDAVVLDEIVLDADDRKFDPTVAKIRRYERHAITRGFNFVTMFPRARPVHITADSAQTGVDARYLCVTDPVAWGEVNMDRFQTGSASRDGDDIAGPLPIAAAAELTRLGRSSRVVLVGDSDFASDGFYHVLGNSDLFLNMVAYLAEEESLISIRPRAPLGDSVYITESQGRLVFAVCLVALPLTSIVTGLLVYFRRRRL
jgi:gliding motility-associatede transport system auxiliary component